MKRVLLITPPYHCGVVESAGTWIPLALAYVASGIRARGFEVEIYDAMGRFDEWPDIERRIQEFKPDVVGSGGYTATTPDAIEVLRLAKRLDPSVTTLLGGIHSTFMWEEALRFSNDAVDYVLIGEAEETVGRLLESLRDGRPVDQVPGVAWWEPGAPTGTIGGNGDVELGGRGIRAMDPTAPGGALWDPYRAAAVDPSVIAGRAVRSKGHAPRTDLDLVVPAWDLIDWPAYSFRPTAGSTLAIVTSSRGCTQECSFCSQQRFYGRHWRGRSPERFVSELKELNRRYGVNVAMLSDETPTFDPVRWRSVLDLLVKEETGVELLLETRVDDILRDEAILPLYRQAGIVHIYVGAESGDQETLDLFKKGSTVEQNRRAIELINEQDIISETAFVLGMPGDTKADVDRTVELAKGYNPDMAFFMAAAPWPYADMHDEVIERVRSFSYRDYNLVVPVMEPETMSLKEVEAALFDAFHRFYMDKMKNLESMTPFKREYMISVFKLLASHSYLKDHMKGMGTMAEGMSGSVGASSTQSGMPEEVRRLLA